MNFGDWAGAVQSIVATAAIVIGAIWAYWKFVKGRTFQNRAELSVEAELLSSPDMRAIRARVVLRNMGLTDIPLRGTFVRVLALEPQEWRNGNWKRVATERVLQEHEWVEPQEPITDEVLIPLADADTALAYQVEFIVVEEAGKRRERGSVQWTARRVVAGALQPVTSDRGDDAKPAEPV